MDITIRLGADDDGIEVNVSDDTAYVPEVASDLLRRAADTALRLHREMRGSDAAADGP